MDGMHASDAQASPTRHRFSYDDFLAMDKAGLLPDAARLELIDGEIVDMAPIGEKHGAGLNSLARALFAACGTRAIVWVQSTVRLGPSDAPQPDFAVLRPRDDFYSTAHPGPDDILLLVEVADTSLAIDRTIKLPRYARAGVPEYWIVDLKGRVLEAYRNPSPGGYDAPATHNRGERLPLAAAPDIVVPLDIVFP